jgi:uncharacterized glyoxalase superfamily protein PhnB
MAALGVAAAVLAVLAATSGLAQTAPKPAVTIAPTLTADAGTQTPLTIRIGPAAALPRNSFVRIRGLPPLAALSDGHSIAPGSWAVPLTAFADLRIALPPDTVGKFDISIVLVAVDGAVLAEGKSTLVVSAARAPAGAQADRDVKAPTSASILRAGSELPAEARKAAAGTELPTARPTTPEDRDRATRLLQKGQDQLGEGNVSSARLFFEKAADAGLAQAAMALAETFDGAELARLGVRGIQGDDQQAKRWYERARDMGAREAEQRLRRLGAN